MSEDHWLVFFLRQNRILLAISGGDESKSDLARTWNTGKGSIISTGRHTDLHLIDIVLPNTVEVEEQFIFMNDYARPGLMKLVLKEWTGYPIPQIIIQ